MNKDRRKQIRQAITDLDKVKTEIDLQATDEETGDEDPRVLAHAERWQKMIGDLYSDVDSIHSDEEDYYENMPDSLKDGDRGTTSQEAIDQLENAKGDLEELESCELADFIAMFHDKYDDLSEYLSTAEG